MFKVSQIKYTCVKHSDTESKAEFDFSLKKAQQEGNDAAYDQLLSNFTYDDDMSGAKCPFIAHIRRINPRASLEMVNGIRPGSKVINKGAFDTPGALTNRRRILRRGLPYGLVDDPKRDDGNHGIIMVINADIARQYEFI